MYYLETNALYQLHSQILANPEKAKVCSTSLLAIEEILAGITREDYDRRKSIAINIARSGIVIDWDTPREIITRSFEIWDIDDSKYRRVIQEVFSAISTSSDYANLLILLQQTPAKSLIEQLQNDEILLCDHSEALGKAKSYYEEVSRDIRKAFRDQWESGTDLQGTEIFSAMMLSRITNLAESILKRIKGPFADLRYLADILSSYNHSIDLFHMADVFLNGERLFHGRQVARNDYLDISHLLFLKDMILVTDDHLLRKIVARFAPTQVVSVDEFRKIIDWEVKRANA
jgi:hypothetical protein